MVVTIKKTPLQEQGCLSNMILVAYRICFLSHVIDNGIITIERL